jgi:hypothetical protein
MQGRAGSLHQLWLENPQNCFQFGEGQNSSAPSGPRRMLARYASRAVETLSQYNVIAFIRTIRLIMLIFFDNPAQETHHFHGQPQLRQAFLLSSATRKNVISRFNAYVSGMDEPNNPGNPFSASYQPGRPASISIPIPHGSSVANLITPG